MEQQLMYHLLPLRRVCRRTGLQRRLCRCQMQRQVGYRARSIAGVPQFMIAPTTALFTARMMHLEFTLRTGGPFELALQHS